MKLNRRIFTLSILLTGAAVLVTSVFIAVSAHSVFYDAVKRELILEASLIRAGYELTGEAYLENLPRTPGRRVTLIAPDGNVRYDNAMRTENMDNHLNRPEVQQALLTGNIGESTRFSETAQAQTYYYAMRLTDGNVLRVSGTTANLIDFIRPLYWQTPLIIAGMLLVSVGVVSLFTRRIIRPINAINLASPDEHIIYEELVPLLKRIREQHTHIERQMNELNRERREFTAVTNLMGEGFLVLDKTGKVLTCNESAARLLSAAGTPPEDLSGRNILAINREVNFRETVQRVLDGGGATHPTNASLLVPGAFTPSVTQLVELHGRQCQLFANPVMENGNIQGVILLLMDITEKQERENLRHEFTTNVSHELKTPLTAISGYAEIIANGMVNAEETPGFAQNIYREAQRLIYLVNDIMYLSGLEENKTPERGTVNLFTLSQDIAQRLTVKAAEQNIKLSVTGTPAEIQGIPTVLDEMVFNLMENAVKYNRPGGSVSVNIYKNENAVVLTVSDTGIGIPKAEQSRIFERFYRVDKSRNSGIPGTGLGLSIVKHGAMLHRAEIEIKSGKQGSSFIVRFAEGG
jgi:two-component system phosphate regulon sensor histidine kinase PhoR